MKVLQLKMTNMRLEYFETVLILIKYMYMIV